MHHHGAPETWRSSGRPVTRMIMIFMMPSPPGGANHILYNIFMTLGSAGGSFSRAGSEGPGHCVCMNPVCASDFVTLLYLIKNRDRRTCRSCLSVYGCGSRCRSRPRSTTGHAPDHNFDPQVHVEAYAPCGTKSARDGDWASQRLTGTTPSPRLLRPNRFQYYIILPILQRNYIIKTM